MFKKFNIFSDINCFKARRILFFLLAACSFPSIIASQTSGVAVNAGQDQIICATDTLELDSLLASITGQVTDGYWFTQGDGKFLPGNVNFSLFSIAEKYVPGPLDIANKGFNLILTSLDPDGIGPMPQVSDIVHVSLINNISIVCYSNLNVALGNDCTQLITPLSLVTNLQQPYSYYTLVLKDKNNKIIPNNVVTKDHIGQNISFIVGHQCGNNCWGVLRIEDKLPPPLTCSNKLVLCGAHTQADSIGLPIPQLAKAKKISTNSYRVTGFDACGPATLSYSDEYIKYQCDTLLQGKILRTWTAIDSFGNSAVCVQQISIKNKNLSQVSLPPNFDDISMPAFECGASYPKLPNGHPSPDTTGVPGTTGCTNLERTYIDFPFTGCGNSQHILRKWTIVNWCGTLILEHNQLIKVKDSSPPLFTCPQNITLNTSPYDCETSFQNLSMPTMLSDCSDTYLKVYLRELDSNIDYSHLLIKNANGSYAVNNLPLGSYTVEFIYKDACENSASCTSSIDVEDGAAPIAVCTQFTKVSLIGNGSARLEVQSINDGSYDNCNIVEIKIAKMTDACGNQALVYKDAVDYCCAESNTKVMTILRVTDASGNSNTCMVEVTVEDKIPPVIKCPDNLTISCLTPIQENALNKFGEVVIGLTNVKPITISDAYNNGIAGYDGYALDNCDVTISHSFVTNVECGNGTWRRTFVAKDKNNNSANCLQIITVKNNNTFDSTDIVFPPNKELEACNVSAATIEVAGKPTFNNVACAQVAATYEDQVFYYTDDVCVKILRKWTVLDWCQFNQDNQTGRWSRLQIIKLKNINKPQITSACKDTTFCIYNEQCGKDLFFWLPQSTDDCSGDSLLRYSWTVDLGNNGSIDTASFTKWVAVDLGPGKHLVSYKVIDECGNEQLCSYIVTARDCKKPTPYCVSSISSVIMPSSGQLTINARSFNLSSYDNCTEAGKLKYSFSENIADSLKTIKCTDIPNGISTTLHFSMWVTDQNNNSDYCDVDFTISDNNDGCPDQGGSFTISGSITNTDLTRKIKGVDIQVTAVDAEVNLIKETNKSGEYLFSSMPAYYEHIIKPSHNDSIANGLSTLDILIIQRHILGSARLIDPYKIIAADVDLNKKVSVSDLVVLRKIVLGVIDKMPGGRNCWTFADKKHIFTNPLQPFDYPDTIIIPKLQTTNPNNDFIGIKLGDVNNSINLTNENLTENRSQSKGLHFMNKEEKIIFSPPSQFLTSGLQLSLKINCDQNVVEINPKFSNDVHYECSGKSLKLIFTPKKEYLWQDADWLFALNDTEIEFALDENFNSEYYDENLNAKKIELELLESPNHEQKVKVVYFNNELSFEWPTNDLANLKVFDVSGRMMYEMKNVAIMPGRNWISMQEKNNNLTMYLCLMTIGNRTFSITML